ncbi:ABC transporter substrate-binding protein [Lentzea aerocolonigenes]|uniref:ABC transporter substrate-binding protein n=1 Tax=Lentzea aerocolonigenes TaxID=68170 RepID=A0A0F0GL71_LENAE|nr:helix-turn-helix domain-containing protein [Lentzea aerocolonigenes]KJK42173.1 ABC transporter substrate-binding protein [Lentzea aerocolonigenes]
MEALATRLSNLDSHVEGAIRVVMFYDTLMRRRVDLPALARASAGLAECVVGIRLHSTGKVIRMSPAGTPAPEPATTPSSTAAITLDEEEIGLVWLERPGPPQPPGAPPHRPAPPHHLDEVLLDRLAIATAAVVERYGPARTTMADPALVELVISSDSDEAGRARALRLLGFAPDQPVQVAAVRSPLALDRLAALVCPSRPVKAAEIAGVGAILATRLGDFPDDVRAGTGTPGCPARSWVEAQTALRFTTARRLVVHYPDLGALALLAHLPEAVLRANADVAALSELPAEDLETLDAYCTTGSLRRAADLLHLHHSSVSRRLEQIGKILDVSDVGRIRLALAAHRLL